MKAKWLGWIVSCLWMMNAHATLTVPMTLVDVNGQGKNIGSVRLDDTIYGLLLTPHLHHLPAGVHGFVVTTVPLCGKDGRAAGPHFDPEHNKEHAGPYRGNGHLGDLPVLIVNAKGQAVLPVLAPRLRLAQARGHSLMILAGMDTYTDAFSQNVAVNGRVACGVIPYY